MYISHTSHFYRVSFIVQGCVFDYRRVDAIKQRQDITDALFEVLTTGKHKGSDWTVKVITKKETPQRKHTRKRSQIVRRHRKR
jgi:hypothetical protein